MLVIGKIGLGSMGTQLSCKSESLLNKSKMKDLLNKS